VSDVVAAGGTVIERVVEQARRGDPEAFVALVEERQASMARIAMAILGNRPDAEDALQNALTSLWSDLPRLRDVTRFDAWADRILVNACRLVLRRRGRRAIREIRDVRDGERVDATRDTLAVPGASLEDAAIDRDRFRRAFESLDADDRALIVLRHLEARSIGDIAVVLGIPDGTVKSRLFTARRALEAALDRDDR
jgi:RNA polymerase sigma-70 factor (ECF subfamily)